jgi:hypothetical protein
MFFLEMIKTCKNWRTRSTRASVLPAFHRETLCFRVAECGVVKKFQEIFAHRLAARGGMNKSVKSGGRRNVKKIFASKGKGHVRTLYAYRQSRRTYATL